MTYQSIKTYHAERGLSCCFRQWRATHSHCRFLHGYALGFRFIFEAQSLDERRWVYDFGHLDWLSDWLKEMFDHTTLIAQDDPELALFQTLHKRQLINLKVLPEVSCEQFAKFVYQFASSKIESETKGRVLLKSVEVMEHGANAAVFLPS